MRLVCLYNDHVKKVSPVFSHHVRHSFVTAEGRFKKKQKENIATQQFVSWVRADREIWATDNQHLHKAKGAVGDEKEFLAMANQAIQNSLSVFAAQNELVCTREEDKWFTVQRCAGRSQRGAQRLTKILHDPFIHVSFKMDHANCFLRITYMY